MLENSALKEKNKLKILSSREKLLSLCAVAILILTFFYDNALLRRGVGLRFTALDGFMLFITDFGFIYFLIILSAYLSLRKKFSELILIFLSISLAFEIGYIFKIFFQTPRPYFGVQVATVPLIQAAGYSFPSIHTVICCSLIPFIDKIFEKKWQKYSSLFVIILIAFSRPYLGVHYVSDIVAGALIGYISGKLWIYLEKKYQLIEWFFFHIKDKFEFRRQIAHLFIGMTIVFLLKLKLLSSGLLFVILIIGGLISFISRKYKIPIIYEILLFFERPEDLKTFPGKGSLFLIMGSWLTTIFFKEDIALAAIMIVAIGDSVATIIGKFFGKIKNPLNSQKHLEGTVLAIVFSTLGAFYFVNFKAAFAASLITLVIESIYPSRLSKIIDDNLIIPIIAGLIILFF